MKVKDCYVYLKSWKSPRKLSLESVQTLINWLAFPITQRQDKVDELQEWAGRHRHHNQQWEVWLEYELPLVLVIIMVKK